MHDAFKRALIENPDDLAGWSAYADYLTEQGDPRGEFMQAQLALEDESRSKDERDALKECEAGLLAAHEREWLGGLAPFILDAEPIYRDVRRITHRFARGWLAELRCESLSVAEARVIARDTDARFLRQLTVGGLAYEAPAVAPDQDADSYYDPGPDIPTGIHTYDGPALLALAGGNELSGVRLFGLGDGPSQTGDDGEQHGFCSTSGMYVREALAKMPRIEEVYLYAHSVPAAAVFALPLPHLRILRYEHEMDYPLQVLADNPTLGNLTHLLCHPHAQRPEDPVAYIRLDQLRAVCQSPHLSRLTHLQLRLTDFGDQGIEEIIQSGLLKRLRVLDLSLGCVTDRGAALLAARPELKNLALLDLSANALTDVGIAMLRATGVNVVAERQHGEHPDQLGVHGYLDYLGEGDME